MNECDAAPHASVHLRVDALKSHVGCTERTESYSEMNLLQLVFTLPSSVGREASPVH
jgi:hypothetical protein